MNAVSWALLTAFIWGIVPLMEKVGLGNAPPTVGVIVRSWGIVLGVLVFSLAFPMWSSVRLLRPTSILLLAGGGLLASFIGQMAFYQALKSGAVSQVTPMAGAYPLVTACLGWILLREPFTFTRLAGVLLIIFGVALLRK